LSPSFNSAILYPVQQAEATRAGEDIRLLYLPFFSVAWYHPYYSQEGICKKLSENSVPLLKLTGRVRWIPSAIRKREATNASRIDHAWASPCGNYQAMCASSSACRRRI